MERPTSEVLRVLANVVGMLIAGMLLALWIADCRERRETHDAVIRMEEQQKK